MIKGKEGFSIRDFSNILHVIGSIASVTGISILWIKDSIDLITIKLIVRYFLLSSILIGSAGLTYQGYIWIIQNSLKNKSKSFIVFSTLLTLPFFILITFHYVKGIDDIVFSIVNFMFTDG